MPNPTWASIIQNDEEVQGDIVFLPQPQTIQKGAGIFETITYKKQEDDSGGVKYFRATECSRTITVRRRISKRAKQREGIAKFGECLGQKVHEPERGITDVCPEPVLFEWEHEKIDDDEEDENIFSAIMKRSAQETLLSEIIPEHLRQDKSQEKKPRRMADRYGRRYGSRADTTEMEDTPTIRLLDIPTNTQFHDLLDLVRVFHSLKIKLPRDQDYPDGSRNRGFAFITFSSHEDAERAKDALDGHAYGTNILHAEWSRNYANFMKATPEVQQQVRSSSSGFGGGPGLGSRRGGRPRFTNSKKGENPV